MSDGTGLPLKEPEVKGDGKTSVFTTQLWRMLLERDVAIQMLSEDENKIFMSEEGVLEVTFYRKDCAIAGDTIHMLV